MRKNPRILITAGPTIEPIDPVRFISNRSSGYMGYELAKEAKRRRYKVKLISGPVSTSPPRNIKISFVETAHQLHAAIKKEIKKTDILIMTSAVSDFRPRNFSKNKIKAQKRTTLELIKNPDILCSISKKDRKNKVIVGFSLETKNLLRNAIKKLESKSLNLIVANKLDRKNRPFGKGIKTVYLLDSKKRIKTLKNMTKTRIARAILDTVEELCYTPN